MASKIQLGNQSIPYTIKYSTRARYLRLKIDSSGLQIIVPTGTKLHNLDQLLIERQNWILKHLQRIQNANEQRPQRQFITGETLPFLGEAHHLALMYAPDAKRGTVSRQAQTIRVRLPSTIPTDKQAEMVRHALEKWYRQQARRYISQRVDELAAYYGFQVGKISIRDQKTRWGSCSSLGNLNFNWRLIMTPPAAIDYLIIHELCHLREPNHSVNFWNLVAYYCPDYQAWRRWFKQNGQYLYL